MMWSGGEWPAAPGGLSVSQVGIGAFGSRIALRLLWSGFHSLQVYDVTDLNTRYFCNNYGGLTGSSPRAMGECSDIVVTVLPSAEELRKVCFGWEGLALEKGLKPGGIVIDFGQSDPIETIAIAKDLAACGIHLIDAPAFGTPDQAKEGKLTLIVGGDDDAIAKAKPVLDLVGSRMLRAGAVGSAQAASAIADYMRGVELLAASEALRLGEKFGFEPANLLDLCDALGGAHIDRMLREDVVTRRFKGGLPLGVIRKNLDLAVSFATASGVQLPLLAATREAWTQAEDKIGWGMDHTAIIKWLETLTVPESEPEQDATGAQSAADPAVGPKNA